MHPDNLEAERKNFDSERLGKERAMKPGSHEENLMRGLQLLETGRMEYKMLSESHKRNSVIEKD